MSERSYAELLNQLNSTLERIATAVEKQNDNWNEVTKDKPDRVAEMIDSPEVRRCLRGLIRNELERIKRIKAIRKRAKRRLNKRFKMPIGTPPSERGRQL